MNEEIIKEKLYDSLELTLDSIIDFADALMDEADCCRFSKIERDLGIYLKLAILCYRGQKSFLPTGLEPIEASLAEPA